MDEPTDAEPERTGTFASLSIPIYRHLFWSGLWAFIAVGVQITARVVLTLELTDSIAALGAVFFSFGIGMALANPLGGVAADRFDKRLIVILAHLSLTFSAAAIGFAVIFDVVAFWMVLASGFLQGATFTFMGPSRVAIVGETVPRPLVPNALSLTQFTVGSTQIIGPALGGALIEVSWIGIGGVYLLGASMTLIGIQPILRIPRFETDVRTRMAPLAELADSVRYVSALPRLRLVIGSTLLIVLVSLPYTTFIGKFVEDVYEVGDAWIGWLYAANAIGGTAASLWTARLASARAIWRVRPVAGLGIVVGLALFAVTTNVWVALPVLLLAGAFATMFQMTNMSLSLMLAETTYHGRVQALVMLGFSLSSLASFPLGALADRLGLRETHYLMAAGAAVVVGYALVRSARLGPPD